VEQQVEASFNLFRIQVGSFARQELAEEMGKELESRFSVTVRIRKNPATGTHQVRIGEFSSRDEARNLLTTLKDAGFKDAFVVQETVSEGGGGLVVAVRGSQNLYCSSQTGFVFAPASPDKPLTLNGRPYRGVFEVVMNPSWRMTVINQLGIEEYLLGVVPAEISPTQYPEFAALAAQAIAARTYALKNMGRFKSEGYDLSADTRTQVYDGIAAETPATNEAVLKTFGLAIYYRDKLIDAMYTSTCGGRTEDFANVFDAPPVPYLQSVFCAVEGNQENNGNVLEGKHALERILVTDEGRVANRNLELALVLGIVENNPKLSLDFLEGTIQPAEAARWMRNAVKIAQPTRPLEHAVPQEAQTRAGFLHYAATSFFGADEIQRTISPSDAVYYLDNLRDGHEVPEFARPALAYLMQRGLWQPYSDNTVRPKDPMRRLDAIFLLLQWVESAKPEILRRGTFVSLTGFASEENPDPTLSIKWGNRTQEFPLSRQPYLYRLDAGRYTPVDSLKIIGNEKIAFHVNSGGIIDFLEVELNPTGASSDRYSPVATWDVTLSRSAVAEKLRSLSGDIGELRDLRPARIGNSGRVVQIEVIGSKKSVVLNGYRVRNALGLRDTLFTLTRQHNPDGSVASFRFHGRGWGHGVGLCQVGAYGMARAGRSYEEILKTYYQGVEIRRAY